MNDINRREFLTLGAAAAVSTGARAASAPQGALLAAPPIALVRRRSRAVEFR